MNPIVKHTYYVLRPFIPLQVRWFLQKRVAGSIDGFRVKPVWPLPEAICENGLVFSEAMGGVPFVITHDVDTRFGFEHIKDVVEVERRLGLRGSWNIVPDLYEVDDSVLEYLRDSGMEIGVHDWNHDGRLFSDKTIFDERVKKINCVIKEWEVKGFRAGMAFHNAEWMQELVCEYDSSYYDSDPYQPMGGGCAQIRPFMLGRLVELPYTMPQDHVLFVARAGLKVPRVWEGEEGGRNRNWEWIRGYIDRNGLATGTHRHTQKASHSVHSGLKGADYFMIKGVDIWKMKAEWLMERGGMVLMITHPDYLCHPKLRAKSKEQRAKSRDLYDGWLGEDDGDIQEVRGEGIIGERWCGSLLEQYAAFLNWFKREFVGQYWHCLPLELARKFKEENVSTD